MTQHRATVVLLALVVMLLSACSTSRIATPTTGESPAVRGTSASNLERLQTLLVSRQHIDGGSDYVIAPGDLVVVTIYNFRPEGGNFESDVRVDDGGYLSLPMIEPIHAAGLSVAQVRAALVESLRRAKVMNQPMVSIFLKDYQGQQVVVLGAVGKPGMYHLSRGQQTLVDIMSMAGGLTATAGNYVLVRPAPTSRQADAHALLQEYALKTVAAVSAVPEDDEQMVVIDLETRDGRSNPALLALPMRAGDLLIVPEAGQAFIDGEVAKPGPVPLTHGMTLTQLITSAGGLTFPADRARIELIRGAATQISTHWQVDLNRIERQEQSDVILERNDRIVVPATPGRKVAYVVYRVFTDVVRVTVGGAATIF